MAEKKKKKSSFGKTFFSLALLVPSLFRFTVGILSLVAAEARLAGRSMVLVAMLALLIASTMATTWLCILASLFLYFTTTLLLTPLVAMGALILINLIVIAILTLILNKVKKNLSFPATLQQLKKFKLF